MKIRTIKLSTRALLSFGIICLLLIGLGAVALLKMSDIHESAVKLKNDWLPSVRQASRIESAGLLYRLDARRFVMEDTRQNEASIKKINQLKANLTKASQDYLPLISGTDEQQLYNRVASNIVAYQSKIDELMELSKTRTVQEMALFIQETSKPQAVALQSSIEELIKINEQGAEQSGIIADESYNSGLTLSAIFIIIAVIVTVLVAVTFTRSITQPIRTLVTTTRKIADGDLRAQVKSVAPMN